MPYKDTERRREYGRKYYEDHREERRISHQKYQQDNAERLAEYDRLYREEHPDQIRAKGRRHDASPEGKASRARRKAKRRQRESQAPVTLTADEWADLLEDQNYACAYCGIPFSIDIKATRDHIISVLLGGGLTKENVFPACQKCNSSKGAKLIA